VDIQSCAKKSEKNEKTDAVAAYSQCNLDPDRVGSASRIGD